MQLDSLPHLLPFYAFGEPDEGGGLQFARKIFGSVETAIGSYYKMPDGTCIQLVGVAEDEKYGSLTEEPHAAVFLPILQWPNGNGVQARHFCRKGTECPSVTNRAR